MALLNYKKGKTVSFQGKGEKAKPVSLAQYIMHYAYGASEPTMAGDKIVVLCDGTSEGQLHRTLQEYCETVGLERV